MTKLKKFSQILSPAVIVAALGYFVDIFDLLLFSIVRKPSLASLGLSEADQISKGLFLHNLQMGGMLLGGLIWGILGDKRGRLSVLFGSILVYSVANLANAYVGSVESYAFWRFIAGIGLAGELGAGITLVAETLTKEQRGYGTTLVATVGVTGAIVAGTIAEFFDWRTTYIIGGMLGIALLLLRIKTAESGIFRESQKHTHSRGSLKLLLSNASRAKRFVSCILVGVPIWFVIGTLVQLAPELTRAMGVIGTAVGEVGAGNSLTPSAGMVAVTAGRAIVFAYSGLAVGDLISGLLSQWFRTRIRVIYFFLAGLAACEVAYFVLSPGAAPDTFYLICFALGFFSGYWALFVTMAAEQFGTNLRATVTTSIPNFVRASVIPMSAAFTLLKPNHGVIAAAQWVGTAAMLVAAAAAMGLRDSFGKDLSYYEVD